MATELTEAPVLSDDQLDGGNLTANTAAVC